MKPAVASMYTGPEFSTRGGRGYFKVLSQDAVAVVEAANLSLDMFRVQHDAYVCMYVCM